MKMLRPKLLLLGAVMLALPTGAVCLAAGPQGTDTAAIGRGHSTADTVCWACHVIGPDQSFSPILREPATDFRVIAQRPGITRESLTAFLQGTHRTEGKPYAMPNPRLSNEMIDDVVAYILSLRLP
jgi:mono/diheme cytochrome c family protein